jgi:hypothetical protein
VRRSAIVALGLAPLAVGVALAAVVIRRGALETRLELEVALGGRSFSVEGATPRHLPGTLTVDSAIVQLVVANRDSVARYVGAALVPARTRAEVPVDLCAPTTKGSRVVVVVR